MKTLKTLPNFFNNEGHLNEEGISLYADALMNDSVEELPASLKAHVEECLHCKSEIIEVYELSKENAETKVVPLYRSVEHKAENMQYLRIAASFIVLIGLGFVFFQFLNNEKLASDGKTAINHPVVRVLFEPNNVMAIDKTAVATETSELLASNYLPSSNLESMVGVAFRSEAINIISPKNSTIYKLNDQIVFQYELEGNAGTLNLKILNNKEDIVFQTNISGNKYLLNKKLSGGLYYWKLETDEDLLYVGKFIIK